MKKIGQTEQDAGAVEIIEQATGLLRRVPASSWVVQSAGTMVFILAALHFLADMGRAADAAQRLVLAALGLSLAYALMKHAHALFGHAVLDALQGGDGRIPRLSPRDHFRLFAGQILIHATMPWLMFLSLLAMLPAAWTHAAYHNSSVLAVGALRSGDGVGALVGRAVRASHHAARQNHGIAIATSVIALFTGLNLLVLAMFLPQLARILSGSENALSLNPMAGFNTTVVAAVVLLTWFAINPLARACHALRCFHFVSRRNGDDLRAGLRALPVLVLVLLAMLFAGTTTGQARTEAPAPISAPGVESFDESMDDVLARPDFRWRLPRETTDEREQTWFGKMIEDVLGWLGRQADAAGEAISKFMRWIFGKDRDQESQPDEAGGQGAGGQVARVLLIALLIIGLVFLVILGIRWFLARRKAPAATVAAATPLAVDLADESVTADALPEDEWLRLAREKWALGDHRLAVRALFLGTLARMGEQGFLAISPGKTNGIYLRELNRQARAAIAMRAAFRDNVTAFEATWYGDHPVDDQAFHRFSSNLETIRNHAQAT